MKGGSYKGASAVRVSSPKTIAQGTQLSGLRNTILALRPDEFPAISVQRRFTCRAPPPRHGNIMERGHDLLFGTMDSGLAHSGGAEVSPGRAREESNSLPADLLHRRLTRPVSNATGPSRQQRTEQWHRQAGLRSQLVVLPREFVVADSFSHFHGRVFHRRLLQPHLHGGCPRRVSRAFRRRGTGADGAILRAGRRLLLTSARVQPHRYQRGFYCDQVSQLSTGLGLCSARVRIQRCCNVRARERCSHPDAAR